MPIDCLLVGQHVSNGANSRFWQLPTQKAKTMWATTFPSGGLAIGHVFGSPSKTTNACVADSLENVIFKYILLLKSMQCGPIQVSSKFHSFDGEKQIHKSLFSLFVVLVYRVYDK